MTMNGAQVSKLEPRRVAGVPAELKSKVSVGNLELVMHSIGSRVCKEGGQASQLTEMGYGQSIDFTQNADGEQGLLNAQPVVEIVVA